ncbi:hypothetical protein O6H91_21G038800 [Diphasiastrum complanatum]|uniref:Uncharacterized protein n=1 Tax=Diphasiastrum complanatum TaxID=34168 RepID=A0ACC2AJJ0_DIPCM|nr:hypothetical protein O6H91_21G038800 [Diphasiastrum complanatum]
MVDLGNLHFILGIEVSRGKDLSFICQSRYASSILEKFEMKDCKGVETPMEQNVKVSNSDDEASFEDITLYRRLVGSLIYFTITRPDLSYSAGKLSQSMQYPLVCHWKNAKRVLRYISATKNFGILYDGSNLALRAYSDADFVGDKVDRRSTSAFVTFLCNGIVSWLSKKQDTISLSSTESEYKALTSTTKEILWLKRLLVELQVMEAEEQPIIFCDNQSNQALATNPTFHARSKHIEIAHHFVREKIQAKEIKLHHVSSSDCLADLLTKALPNTSFIKLRSALGVVDRCTIVISCKS